MSTSWLGCASGLAQHSRVAVNERASRSDTDLSPKMVEFVTERIASRGLSDRITTEQADAQSLTTMKVLP